MREPLGAASARAAAVTPDGHDERDGAVNLVFRSLFPRIDIQDNAISSKLPSRDRHRLSGEGPGAEHPAWALGEEARIGLKTAGMAPTVAATI